MLYVLTKYDGRFYSHQIMDQHLVHVFLCEYVFVTGEVQLVNCRNWYELIDTFEASKQFPMFIISPAHLL